MPRKSRLLPSLRSDLEALKLTEENRGLIHVGMVIGFRRAKVTPQFQKENPDDAFQVGWFGLYRAAQIWDPAKSKFSTYGTAAVARRVSRWCLTDAGMIHVPAHLFDKGRYAKAVRNYKGGPRPAIGDVRLTFFNFDNDVLEKLCPMGKEPVEWLGSEEEGVIKISLVQIAMRCLEERQRFIILCRYFYGMSLKETAEEVHLTKERVRQVQLKCLERMRKYLSSLGLARRARSLF